MNVLLVMPVVIPLIAAALGFLTRKQPTVQRFLGASGAIVILASGLGLVVSVLRSGIQVTALGGWSAPFGIVFVADLFSAAMVAVTGLVGSAVILFAWRGISRERRLAGYYPLVLILLSGVSGAFLTGDLFNLYVWFEVLLISSFVLLVTANTQRNLDGAIRYVALNLVSSALFLTGLGLLYGKLGTLNMADVALKIGGLDAGLRHVLGIVFMCAFAIKGAAFPFFFWLPASYDTPPVDVSALFGGLLTKVGIYAMIRTFTLVFTQDAAFTHSLILAVAVLTMVVGVIGAVGQVDFRKVLSFHIVSQVGYMLMGLGLFTPLAIAGALFYMVHHILVKTGLFLIAGSAMAQSGTLSLKKMGGLVKKTPVLAALFGVAALSLAGLPPFSGFFAKLVLARAGFEAEAYGVVAASLAVSAVTLLSMNKLWSEAFWKASPADSSTGTFCRLEASSIVVLAGASVLIGLGAETCITFFVAAADQLMHPEQYIQAVMGET